MVNRNLVCALAILLGVFSACCDDPYPRDVTLLVPVTTVVASSFDTLVVGDTVVYVIDMPKEVAIYDSNQRVRLDDFRFGIEYFISEISESVETYDVPIEITTSSGTVDTLDFSTGTRVYPIFFEETDDQYHLVLAVQVKAPGTYWAGFNSLPKFFEIFNHPFTETCQDVEGRNISLYIENNITSREQYEEVFITSPATHFAQTTDYDRYASGGSHTFVVVE